MARLKTIRFAFELSEGASDGFRLTGWRVSVRRNDVFISNKSMQPAKVTLHDDATSTSDTPWRLAFTKEHMERPDPLWPVDRDRALRKFAAVPFVKGVRRVFVVAAPRAALRPMAPDPREVSLEVPDRWDMLTVASVVMSEPDVSPVGGELVTPEPLRLQNGRCIWLFRDQETITRSEPEAPPDGNLVKLLTPDQDEVSCPGWMVAGARLKPP